ncbi:N-6 DNA methylase [Haladaptatus sp. AB618]|uniref:Eco57I restriction-modification methylase domain-containing protein n=1 Tax=Haladaptatus sp. AB618 TaxID=2934173 RepID=UPI00209BEB61|nr:N-6 DNA methylase [Haladaptatus sp. AB618]MCO8255270.1 N-6 DNA methylase [Haladaptatus sp. AB618]
MAPRRSEPSVPELPGETVRQALELVTDDLVTDSEATATSLRSAFDAALVGVFGRLVDEFSDIRGVDRPPFATSDELRTERARFEALSAGASERLDETIGSLAFDSLSFRQVSGLYERSLDYEPEHTGDGIRLSGDATRRATVGAYYTPDAVVEYTVSQALDGTEDARLIDPAMGSGNFLTCAIDRLARGRDEPRAQARRFVAENRIFGMDLDPLAVELARTAVWFETGVWPDETLRVGDALAADPEWFEGRTFEAVVGNPPYVRSRHVSTGRKADLRKRFDTVTGAFDLYVAFVERMAELGERVSCIVPNKWTTARYGRTLRDHLLDRHRIVELLDVSNASVFADASVYPVVLTFDADSGPTETISVRQADTNIIPDESPQATLSQSFVNCLGGRVIPVGIDPEFASLAEQLCREFEKLGTYVTMTEGIHTGNVREKLVVDEPGPDCEPLVGGGDVSRYGLEWDGDWIRFDPSLIGDGEYGSLRDRSVFESEKLLLRDISERPVATYDGSGMYALNTLYSVRSRADPSVDSRPELPLRYLLSVVNSAVSGCWFQQVYGGTHVSGGYLRFKPMFTTQLPIPTGEGERDELVELAERLEELTETRAEMETRLPKSLDGPRLGNFVRRIDDGSILTETTETRERLRVGSVSVEDEGGELVFWATARYRPAEECETDSWGFVETESIRALVFDGANDGGLERNEWRDVLRWYVPQFVESEAFTEEAMKTISPLDRLEAVRLPSFDVATAFAETCRSAAQLDAKIERTDAEIDRLVARAYGLSDDEIALIERLVD